MTATWCAAVTLLMAVYVRSVVASTLAEADHCQTTMSEVTVGMEKLYEYKGQAIRLMCRGTVRLNKCEGLCMSRVSPSVVTFPGFKRECRCCRESSLEDHKVTLSHCSDGMSHVPGQFTVMYIRQPTSCHCFNCET